MPDRPAYEHLPECDVAIWLEKQIADGSAPRWLGVPDGIDCQCVKLHACQTRILANVPTLADAIGMAIRETAEDTKAACVNAVQAAFDDLPDLVCYLPDTGDTPGEMMYPDEIAVNAIATVTLETVS